MNNIQSIVSQAPLVQCRDHLSAMRWQIFSYQRNRYELTPLRAIETAIGSTKSAVNDSGSCVYKHPVLSVAQIGGKSLRVGVIELKGATVRERNGASALRDDFLGTNRCGVIDEHTVPEADDAHPTGSAEQHQCHRRD